MNTNLKYLSCSAALLAVLAQGASAQVFDAGIPAGWHCQGSCGTAEADGDVPLVPGGGMRYGWISNTGGVAGVRLPGVGVPNDSHDGSLLQSHRFDAQAGATLALRFNYITTDGGDFGDYAWIRLLDGSGSQVALLVTARTSPGGGAVPGYGMPAGQATLTPPYLDVWGTEPIWSPLGADAGTCYVTPCGTTGWGQASYAIAAAGSYMLEFGVVNWVDASADSGLAFDALTLDGVPLAPVPEPGMPALLAAGMLVLGARYARRWK